MNNINEEIDKLFDSIENMEIYKNYVNAKKKLESNTEIMNLIKEIKRMQKIATNNKDEILENKIKYSYNKLICYPIYQSYLIFKVELEEELFMITENFNKYFEKILFIDIN